MIEAQQLTRRFGALTAVSQLSLAVPAGSILALLGPNGAGKTTTVRMLAGLIAPSEGEATVAGYNVRTDAASVRANVGLMTDVPGLYEQMTPENYLHFFGKIYGMSQAQRTRRIRELLELFELAEQRNTKLEGFSRGMKQKVALARALLHDPSVIFLDEPTSGLDPLIARTVRELILSLKHASRSLILCTHDLNEAEKLADQIAIMRHGQLVACDTPTALRAKASSESEVELRLAAPFPRALEILNSLPDITAPLVSASGEDGTGGAIVVTYRTSWPERVNPRLLRQLIEAGAQPMSLIYATSSLEDVYTSAMQESRNREEEATSLVLASSQEK